MASVNKLITYDGEYLYNLDGKKIVKTETVKKILSQMINRTKRMKYLASVGGCHIPGCGQDDPNKLTVHHVLPICMGGLDDKSNWFVICQEHHKHLNSGFMFMNKIKEWKKD